MNSKQVADVFDGWAKSGRAQTMADGHAVGATRGFELLTIEPGHQVLDIGCGLGYAVRWASGLSSSVSALGVDVSPTMIEQARLLSTEFPNSEFICGEFPEVVQGRRFDRIFSVEALYYVPDLVGVLTAVYKHLEPGGRFVTVIDHYQENTACHNWTDMVGVPLVLWSISEWCDTLRLTGFADVTAERVKHPPSSSTQPWQEEQGSLILKATRSI